GIALTLLSVVCGALGGRRYIAIPVDGIEGIDVIEVSPITSSLSRVARQTEAYVPIAVPSVVHQDDSREQRSERSAARVLDYVDFGGQTGSDGAFSWYADYPAHHL
ncbi:tudor and kh domain-containing protein, partial [Lasius niger]